MGVLSDIGHFINEYSPYARLWRATAGVRQRFSENLSNGSYLMSTKDQMDYQDYLQRQNWQRENAYNSPAAQMERYRAAGLNPDLIYGQSNAAGSIGSIDIPQSSPAARTAGVAMDVMQKALNADAVQSQIDLNKSLAHKAEAEAGQASANSQRIIASTLSPDLYEGLAKSQLDLYEANARESLGRLDLYLSQRGLYGAQTNFVNLQSQCQAIKNSFQAANEEANLRILLERVGLTHEQAKLYAAEGRQIIETLPYRIEYLRASTSMLRASASNQSAQASLAESNESLNTQRSGLMTSQSENLHSQVWYREQMGQTLYKEIYDALPYRNLMVLDPDTDSYQFRDGGAAALGAADIILDKATQYLGRVVHFGFGNYQHQNNTPVSSKVRETQSWTDGSGRRHTVSRHRDPKD